MCVYTHVHICIYTHTPTHTHTRNLRTKRNNLSSCRVRQHGKCDVTTFYHLEERMKDKGGGGTAGGRDAGREQVCERARARVKQRM